MTMLIELGATQLIEMGSAPYMGATPSERPSPVLDLFKVVNFIEDPFQGTLEPGEVLTAKQKAIAQQLQTISRVARKGLSGNYGIGDLGRDLDSLCYELNEITLREYSLGKKKHGFGGFIKKIGKVVKSPAFLSVVGVVANVIPGVGQVASAALLTTAGIMAKKQQAAKQKKAMQKAEKEAAAQAAAADNVQLDAYYQQNGQTWLWPSGYTPDVWSKLSVAQKRDVLTQLSNGTLQNYVDPQLAAKQAADAKAAADAETARAAALSIAMQKEYAGTGQIKGQGIDIKTLPAPIQAQAQALAPQYEKEIEVAGKDNFLAAAKKAAGQGAAIEDIFSAAGVPMPGGKVFSQLDDPKILAAGQQDLKNSAAASGGLSLVDQIFSAGGFPVVPVVVGTVVIGGVLYFVLR